MMNIAIPAAAILAVIIIAYFATKRLGIAIRFHLLLLCGLIGLFLGLMLPRILLPQLSLAITLLVLVLFMLLLSVVLAWIFAKEDIDDEQTAFATNVAQSSNIINTFKEKIEKITTNSSEKLGWGGLQKFLFEEVTTKEEPSRTEAPLLNTREVLSIDETFEDEDVDEDVMQSSTQDNIPVMVADEVALAKTDETDSLTPIEVIYPEIADEKESENDVITDSDNAIEIIEEVISDEKEQDDLIEDDDTEEWHMAEFDPVSINAANLDVTEYTPDVKEPTFEAIQSSNILAKYSLKKSAYNESFDEKDSCNKDAYAASAFEGASFHTNDDDTTVVAKEADAHKDDDHIIHIVAETQSAATYEGISPIPADTTIADNDTVTDLVTNDTTYIDRTIEEESEPVFIHNDIKGFANENNHDSKEDAIIYNNDDVVSFANDRAKYSSQIFAAEQDRLSFTEQDATVHEAAVFTTIDMSHTEEDSAQPSNDDKIVASNDKIFEPINKDCIDIPMLLADKKDVPKQERIATGAKTDFVYSDISENLDVPEQLSHLDFQDNESDNPSSEQNTGSYEHTGLASLPYSRVAAKLEKVLPTEEHSFIVANSGYEALPVPKSDSIDDILDFAFEQKECKNPDAAIMALNIAYDMYMHLESSVPIIVEIANIYRECGNYKEAISALQRGLANISNENMRKDFIANIAYLRTIRNILSTNNLGLLPYNEIPDKVKEEIEKEFSEWKSASN